jgi:hypothetical protein
MSSIIRVECILLCLRHVGLRRQSPLLLPPVECLAAIPIFAKIAEAAPERVNLGSLRPPRGVQREALLTDGGDHFHNLAFSPGRK